MGSLVMAKSFISMEGQIRSAVGENICKAATVTKGLDFICQRLTLITHFYLDCLSENMERRSNIKELKQARNEQDSQSLKRQIREAQFQATKNLYINVLSVFQSYVYVFLSEMNLG